jgi:DNA-binding transcriptional ArsR family regulator
MGAHVVTVNDVLDGHVALDIQCLDRVYLNAYVPILQTSAQVVAFLSTHLGYPFPSPALFNQLGQRFRRAVESYAASNDIPWVKFGKDDDKLATMTPHLARQAASGSSGVAAIGVAQEFQRVWTAIEGKTSTGTPRWSFYKADRRVTCYYFYLWDDDFGAAFIKLCAYFPYPGKVWINGHEWAKRQATKAGIAYTQLSNGFAACEDPQALQDICDRLGPGTIHVFVERWLARLPLPLTNTDRDHGYWWETSMRQVEISRTIVFDAPRHARGFFEALIGDNLDLGRPHNVEIIFGRRVRRDTIGTFRTAIDRRDNGGVLLNVFYRHSRIKQYLKDGRAMRIETVINHPRDLGCNARLPNLDDLQTKARACNQRILHAERVGQGCVLASPAFERIAHPTVDAAGCRTPALRFGDPRVMALTGALCQTLLAATGFTNKSLRALIAGLLGSDYRANQMTYDLRRLRQAGLIRRQPRSNRYRLTDDGIRIAIFYTKIYNRLLVPLTAANQPQAPTELRAALSTIDRHVQDYIARARLPQAAQNLPQM